MLVAGFVAQPAEMETQLARVVEGVGEKEGEGDSADS